MQSGAPESRFVRVKVEDKGQPSDSVEEFDVNAFEDVISEIFTRGSEREFNTNREHREVVLRARLYENYFS